EPARPCGARQGRQDRRPRRLDRPHQEDAVRQSLLTSYSSPPNGGEENDESAERDRVHQPAVGPQRILAALELQPCVLADIALEAVAVIPDLLDDVVHPLLVDADRLALARSDAEAAPDR